MNSDLPAAGSRKELEAWLSNAENDGRIIQTNLKPSDRVIARVTDGIYRQPASALRELISNAWDADAQNVTILTDAPRFSTIYVRDDGLGMSYQTLSRLLHSIGGSAKRINEGIDLGITDAADPDLSPSGRQIIGKIGIGLFSVSQLSTSFRIITKTKGVDFRLIAEIQMHQYREDSSSEPAEDYIAGQAFIRREHADDVNSHGTDIILEDIRPRVRDMLRGAEKWESIKQKKEALLQGDIETWSNLRIEDPIYHSGYLGRHISKETLSKYEVEPVFPWDIETPASDRMAKLVDAVESGFSRKVRPDLSTTFDNYLEMIWNLGLSCPVPYVDCHPFELSNRNDIEFFWIKGSKGKGEAILIKENQSVRSAINQQFGVSLLSGYDPKGQFRVVIDNTEIKRPIRFKHHKSELRGLDKAQMFIGTYSPDLSKVSDEIRGGDLSLEGYLFWTGRVVPKENNGVLVKIREASGALFDPTFLKYQVSEQTRLRQISSELFVRSGMDAALNIDRESFNFSHPHYQLVSLWLHGSIRQLTNRLKDTAKLQAEARNNQAKIESESAIVRMADDIWSKRRGKEPPPEVRITTKSEDAFILRSDGYLVIDSIENRQQSDYFYIEALAKVLFAHGVLENINSESQEHLISDIIKIFRASI